MITFIKNLLHPPIDPETIKKNMEEDGYVILKRFFKKKQLREFDRELKNILENRETLGGAITIDVLNGPLMAERLLLREAPDIALKSSIKVNDLYLESEACRQLNLNEELCELLEELLGDPPMVINSLSFNQGSQQPHHFDYYYMPPHVEDKMIVSSICLEKQKRGCGPISYYPGSHKIPPYRFSHGGIHAVSDEMQAAKEYTMAEIEKRGLKQETFYGKAGDVLLWHCSLYHGGQPIEVPKSTRKTLVTHYWRTCDVAENRVGITENGGHYFIREHQAV